MFLQAAHQRRPGGRQLLAGPVQEAGGFPELLLVGGALRFFLASGRRRGQKGDLFGEGRELLRQPLEPFETLDALADGLDLIGGDTLAEIFALEPSLEDIVRPLAEGFALAGGFEELLAQMAAAETVDGRHLLEDLFPALLEFDQVGVHESYCIDTILFCEPKNIAAPTKLHFSGIGYFFVLHPRLPVFFVR